ncbi:HAMP domain-containing protein [Azospirillum sp. RWY-5-1]|uniref:histidine kinase n=1 Tax=Azospirillum oleiclasticum TaxID=2735135 RepID=A0ABX2THQ4_9PROT|nr:ATP-binding protein [Azospirillum oleiclasticum]NYZ16286.1 HAMP domain-containing protein [Azospirillum oleiclasticum]NYZ23773.1 HAMP domain-containing protein [Azospirillum oleiclasticum]
MTRPRRALSVRAIVLAAACVVAAMTVVAAAVSWIVYARIETLLLTVSAEQAQTLPQALKLADAANRYAAGAAEVDAARNPLQRQNAAVALAQHAQALHEALAALRLSKLAAGMVEPVESLVMQLEETLARLNRLTERRIELEGRARRLRAELNRLKGELDATAGRMAAAMPWASATRDFESTAARALLRLFEAGQIDQPSALRESLADYTAIRARMAGHLATMPGESARALGHLTNLDRLATGPEGVFPTRDAQLDTRVEIDGLSARAREIATRLGVAVTRLVGLLEAEGEAAKRAVAEQIDTGRRSLLLVGIATFLGPVVLVWLAVGRVIVLPLARLAEATRRIAAGDLQAPVPATRHREFTEIADALAVFRDNTAALADRTRALQRSEDAQRHAREEAEQALADLRDAQEQLIQAEKMAALAALVAGVAHEINTPIGIALTSASLLAEEVGGMRRAAEAGTLRRSEFDEFLGRAAEMSSLLMTNMDRAAGLVHAFKQVAADQSSEQRRPFDLRDTLEQTLTSLSPLCQKLGHASALDCPLGVEVDSYPGALSQVITILVMNACDHAFEPGRAGHIHVEAAVERGSTLRIEVSDDGRGIPEELQRRIFEPFFTTRRSRGNTGLGLHIAFNIVRRTLKGRIDLVASPTGARFAIRMPMALPAEAAERTADLAVTPPAGTR